MTKGVVIKYTKDELSWLYRNRKTPRKQVFDKFCKKFNRNDLKLFNIEGLYKRKGWSTGRKGRKGHKLTYKFNPNNEKSRFQKGNVPLHKIKPIGYEYINKNGYVVIKAEEHKFVFKQRYLWEKVYGKIPEDMCLKCIDGNKENVEISNWELIPRGSRVFLNGYHGNHYDNIHNELKEVTLTLAKVKYAKSKALKI
jgi:hypothetical protein